jgi:hypothetical protein
MRSRCFLEWQRYIRYILMSPLVALAWLALHLIDLSINALGARRTYRLLLATSPNPLRTRGSLTAVARIGRVVRRAGAHREDFCLRRALLIWWSLRWLGVRADVHCDHGLEKGHAWTEMDGIVVGDRGSLAGTGRFGRFSELFARVPTGRSGIER